MTDLPLNKHDRDDRWLDIWKNDVVGELEFPTDIAFSGFNLPPVFTITTDRGLVFGEGVTPEDAARAIERAFNTVREMTVEQITELLRDYYAKSNAITFTQCARDVALALAKLGTMRIKEQSNDD